MVKFSHFHKFSAAGKCQKQAFILDELAIEAFRGCLGVIWVSSCLIQREEKLLETVWKSAALHTVSTQICMQHFLLLLRDLLEIHGLKS